MVPPLLMDIQPDQWVLDMCAAPGSKTAQIIEAVDSSNKLNEMPTGLVVANDADYKRSHMLVHQSKRLQSPCFMATNHDGAHFPNIHVPRDDTPEGKLELPWQFDRVLCDVPCSGDGTIRKNEKIWDNWTVAGGLSLHSTQVQIFARGCQLVKVGGRIVYSTCSFNPIENEAVVAEVLRQTKGAIQLVDVSTQLPELKRKPGLSTWKVTNKEGVYLDSLQDIPEERQRKKFPASAFPPTAEEAKDMHLERCLRIYPHQQDTGGFFVAVFEKVAPLTATDRVSLARIQGKAIADADLEAAKKEMEEVETETVDADAAAATAVAEVAVDDKVTDAATEVTSSPETPMITTEEEVTPPAKRASVVDGAEIEVNPKKVKTSKDEEKKLFEGKPKRDVPGIKEAPFEMMSPNSPDLDEITQFYGLDPSFPRDQFLLRSEGSAKGRSLYFVSSSIKKVLESKDFGRLQTVNTGVRLFVRQSTPLIEKGCPFRLTSEGLPLLDTVMTDKRRITVNMDALKTLLVEAFPIMEQFPEDVRKQVEAIEMGCCIVHVNKAEEKESQMTVPIVLPVWKGKNSLNVLLNKKDKRSLAQRIFGMIPEATPDHLVQRSTENQELRQEADRKAALMEAEQK